MTSSAINSYSKLTSIPVETSRLIYLPLFPDDQFVRTGSIDNESNIFHVLLHSFDQNYVKMDEDEKKYSVVEIRKKISEKLDIPIWKRLENGKFAMLMVQENYQRLFTNFYKFIQSGKRKDAIKSNTLFTVVEKVLIKDVYKLVYDGIFKLLTIQELYDLTDVCYKLCDDVTEFKIKIKIQSEKLLKERLREGEFDDERFKYFMKKFSYLLECLLDESEISGYSKFIKNFENPENKLSECQLILLSNYFDVDLYFIDSETRYPYKYCSESPFELYRKRDSVVILRIDEDHYEILGRVISGTKKVERKFSEDDQVSKLLYTFHVRPDKFFVRYPNIVGLIPLEIRRQFEINGNATGGNTTDYLSEDEEKEEEEENDDGYESEIYSD
jgi:hypothetical protein